MRGPVEALMIVCAPGVKLVLNGALLCVNNVRVLPSDSYLACVIILRKAGSNVSLHRVFAVPINKAACHRKPPEIVGSNLAGYRA